MSEEKETVQAFFGLDDEFAAPKDATVKTEVIPSVITKEVDFGAGPVKIEAKDQDELIQKVIAAQQEGFKRQIFEQEDLEPAMPQPKRYEEIPEPTGDDLATALRTLTQVDPIGGLQKLLTYAFRMPFEKLVENVQAVDLIQSGMRSAEVGNTFVQNHLRFDELGEVVGGDYFPCPENGKLVNKFLEKNGLDYTPKDLEYAFSQLNKANMLKPFPKDLVAAKKAANAEVSTALSGGDSEYPTEGVELNAIDIEKRAWEIPLEQLENERKMAARRRKLGV